MWQYWVTFSGTNQTSCYTKGRGECVTRKPAVFVSEGDVEVVVCLVGQHCLLTEVLMWQMWKNQPCSVWESLGNLTLFLALVADSAIYFVKIVFS